MNLGVPPVSSGGDFTPPKKGIYNCVVKSFEEIPNPFYEKNLSEGKKADKTQTLWKFVVIDGENKGFEYWYYTGISIGRHPKNKLTNLLKLVYPNFSLEAGSEHVPADEAEMRAGVSLAGVRIVADVTPPKEKVMEDGTKKTVQYGKVVDIWEPETVMPRSQLEQTLADMGATIINDKMEDEIPF